MPPLGRASIEHTRCSSGAAGISPDPALRYGVTRTRTDSTKEGGWRSSELTFIRQRRVVTSATSCVLTELQVVTSLSNRSLGEALTWTQGGENEALRDAFTVDQSALGRILRARPRGASG